jgi:Ca-activated chloride channel homolog
LRLTIDLRRLTIVDTVRSSIVGLQLPTLLLVVCCSALSSSPQNPPETPAIRVESALVSVPVIVSDARGKYLPGLMLSDFKLFQDDVPQRVALFTAGEEPIRIGLLLDTSKSTITVLDKIKKAAREFLLQMRPQDQAFVVSFDANIDRLSNLSSDHRELGDAIKKAKVGEYTGTRMRDAILDAMQGRFRSAQGRNAIVLLTDGQDFGSAVSASDLLGAVAACNTVVYPIHYNVDPREAMRKLFGVRSRLPAYKPGSRRGPYRVCDEREIAAAAYLQELSDLSAGRFYRSGMADLKQTFSQVAEELRHQYLLGFYPERSQLDGSVHSLRVEVSHPGAVVHARRSYRAAR